VDRDPAFVAVIKDGNKFQPGTEGLEVQAKRRNPDIIGMFELRDRTLGDLEPARKLGLADRLGVAKFVEVDLFQGLSALGRKALLGTRARVDLLAQF
jgi:hypothetical protein